jgi:hypothetical protein
VQQSGFLSCGDILDPWKYSAQLPDKLIGTMEKSKLMPKEIWVQQAELVELLRPVLSRLNIPIAQKPSLRTIARQGILAALPGRVRGWPLRTAFRRTSWTFTRFGRNNAKPRSASRSSIPMARCC